MYSFFPFKLTKEGKRGAHTRNSFRLAAVTLGPGSRDKGKQASTPLSEGGSRSSAVTDSHQVKMQVWCFQIEVLLLFFKEAKSLHFLKFPKL